MGHCKIEAYNFSKESTPMTHMPEYSIIILLVNMHIFFRIVQSEMNVRFTLLAR